MSDVPDALLLAEFACDQSEAAFAELVQRHLPLVHSVASRHTANPEHARDITQAVFIILARKAGTLGHKSVLPGWLYHTARLTAANFQRAEVRRVRREQEAYMQSALQESPDDTFWQELSPRLDEAMACLGASERDALVLRYFQNQSVAEVGKHLKIGENAAQKRVSRALEKLRRYFSKYGIASTTAIIAGEISARSVQAAPAAFEKSVTAMAMAKGTTAPASTLTLVKGALKLMTWTKAKIAVVAGIGALFLAGTGIVTVHQIEARRPFAWREKYDLSWVNRLPPQISIFPAIPSRPGSSDGWNGSGMIGLGQTVPSLVRCAYLNALAPYRCTRARIVCASPWPEGSYDFISNIRRAPDLALQKEIQKEFGLAGRRELIETNVFVLTVQNPEAAGFKHSVHRSSEEYSSSNPDTGSLICIHSPMARLVEHLENYLGTPVMDQTGLKGSFDITLEAPPSGRQFNQAILQQLGLKLEPRNQVVDVLVVEKTNKL